MSAFRDWPKTLSAYTNLHSINSLSFSIWSILYFATTVSQISNPLNMFSCFFASNKTPHEELSWDAVCGVLYDVKLAIKGKDSNIRNANCSLCFVNDPFLWRKRDLEKRKCVCWDPGRITINVPWRFGLIAVQDELSLSLSSLLRRSSEPLKRSFEQAGLKRVKMRFNLVCSPF